MAKKIYLYKHGFSPVDFICLPERDTVVIQGGVPEEISHNPENVRKDVRKILDAENIYYAEAAAENVAPDTDFAFITARADAELVLKKVQRLKAKYSQFWVAVW